MRWRAFEGVPRLAGREVHVWSASLRVTGRARAALRVLLTPEEIARADRIVVAPKREQSIVSRGTLRTLLALYTGAAPTDLVLELGPDGRPALVGVDDSIDFNVTHSGDLLLVAFTREGVLGVDVEEARHDVDYGGVGSRFFSPAEQERMARATDQRLAFFRCWTRKEALLKARGTGLRTPLDQFDVTLLPDEEPRIVATRFDPPEDTEWRLTELQPQRGYVGALCADGPPRRIRGLRYRDVLGTLPPS